jgi:arylsulfatase A-like enzyme
MSRVLALVCLHVLLGTSLVTAATRSPNIVLFFVDDLGWADLGYRNPQVIETPRIDQLARESLDFQQCYIPTPTCSPSRAALLTGKHPTRLQFFRHIEGTPDEPFNFWNGDPAHVPSRNWLPLEEVTYAEALKKLGYYNVLVGKWHLGNETYHPIKQGFDRQIGTTNQGQPTSYYPDYFRSSVVFDDESTRYLTDTLTDEAVSFIESYDQDRPFMLSFWYYTVHSPHIGREDYVKHFEAKGITGTYAHYLAMLKSLDDSVGRVRDALQRKGVAQDTVVILLSDQGGGFQNGVFRGGKMVDTLFEGGARVPLLIHWPGVTRPGQNQSIVQSIDLYPTLLEMAGGNPAANRDLDGVSLVEVIRGNTTLNRDKPIFGYRAYQDLYASVRDGDWKLLGYRSGKAELYNLAEDIQEAKDVSAQFPERTERMKTMLVEWERDLNVYPYSGFKSRE